MNPAQENPSRLGPENPNMGSPDREPTIDDLLSSADLAAIAFEAMGNTDAFALGKACLLAISDITAETLPDVACRALSRNPEHKANIVLVVGWLAAEFRIQQDCMFVVAEHLDTMAAA